MANLFLHYAFDAWVGREFPTVRFERYADDVIVHCASRRQAEEVLAAVTVRMGDVRRPRRGVYPMVRGWMQYYGAFRRSELYPILRQLNRRLIKWVRCKYKRYRPWKRLRRRWEQVTRQWPDYFDHWRWTTSFTN